LTEVRYRINSGSIDRTSVYDIDKCILETSQWLVKSGKTEFTHHDVPDLTFVVLMHYQQMLLIYFFFSLPYLDTKKGEIGSGKQVMIMREEAKITAYKGIDTLLLQMYEELSLGKMITDKKVRENVLNMLDPHCMENELNIPDPHCKETPFHVLLQKVQTSHPRSDQGTRGPQFQPSSAAHHSTAWLDANGTLNACCKTCGKKYRLGKDAIVTTAASVMVDFGADLQTMFCSLDSKEHPDMIAEAEWDRVSEKSMTMKEIYLIKQALGSGQVRWWKCIDCGAVQQY
jgi:hypothetical protein